MRCSVYARRVEPDQRIVRFEVFLLYEHAEVWDDDQFHLLWQEVALQ